MIVFLTLFAILFSSLETEDEALHYMGQQPPGLVPEKFAPGSLSKPNRHEFGCTFSADGTECFFGVDNDGTMEIYHTRLEDGAWSPEEKLFTGDSFSYNDPMLSPDESRLYFISNRPLSIPGSKKDVDIWYSTRTDEGWSDPVNVGAPINGPLNEYYVSFAQNGTMYFGSKDTAPEAPRYAYDIYRAEFTDGAYATPQKLPEAINTHRYEADVYIAPDESYMIFCSVRKHGLGQGDLYISFKDTEGNWTTAKNMGKPINSEFHELCPFVTRDGKYLLYTSNQDIYWVSAEILASYR